MSREVDLSKPLSDEDREYLHSRGLHTTVERMDSQFGSEPTDPDAADNSAPAPGGDEQPPENYNEWTVQDLQEEIRERNETAPPDRQMPVVGKKPELVARLQEDDRRNG